MLKAISVQSDPRWLIYLTSFTSSTPFGMEGRFVENRARDKVESALFDQELNGIMV